MMPRQLLGTSDCTDAVHTPQACLQCKFRICSSAHTHTVASVRPVQVLYGRVLSQAK